MARGRKKEVHNHIKRANGTGSIYKLPGNRRNPWTVQLSVGTIKKDDNSYIMKRKRLGYYATREEAVIALAGYTESPYKLQENHSFSDVYNMWNKKYFDTLNSISSERTIISAYNHSKMLWHRTFASITIQDMRDAIERPEITNSIKSRMKSLFNMMYDFAVEAEIVEINKARQFSIKGLNKSVKRERKIKIPISAEHINRLISTYDYGYNRMILIGIFTGFRPSEICFLERRNINLDENYIIGGMKTEAGENRYVPIHPNIREYIEYYFNKTDENDKYLIKAEDGINDSFMTYDKYRARFRKSMNRIGAAGLYSPHCTRHTFITTAKKCNVDDNALKMIVGHEINDITEAVYTHRDREFLHREMRKINI